MTEGNIVGAIAAWGAIVTIIAAIVGVVISIITYIYNKRTFRLRSLAEAFRLLNEKEHREARRVIYGKQTFSSYEIMGLARPTSEEGASIEELETLCRDVVRSDFNEIGTLVHYNLLDGKIFIAEYYWVILKIWDLLEDEIKQRRKSMGPPNYIEHLEEIRNKALEYAKRYREDVYREFSGRM